MQLCDIACSPLLGELWFKSPFLIVVTVKLYERERERESYGKLLLHIIMERIVLWKLVCININKFFFSSFRKIFLFLCNYEGAIWMEVLRYPIKRNGVLEVLSQKKRLFFLIYNRTFDNNKMKSFTDTKIIYVNYVTWKRENYTNLSHYTCLFYSSQNK